MGSNEITTSDEAYIELLEALAEREWANTHQDPRVAKAFSKMEPRSQFIAKGAFIEGFKAGAHTVIAELK